MTTCHTCLHACSSAAGMSCDIVKESIANPVESWIRKTGGDPLDGGCPCYDPSLAEWRRRAKEWKKAAKEYQKLRDELHDEVMRHRRANNKIDKIAIAIMSGEIDPPIRLTRDQLHTLWEHVRATRGSDRLRVVKSTGHQSEWNGIPIVLIG